MLTFTKCFRRHMKPITAALWNVIGVNVAVAVPTKPSSSLTDRESCTCRAGDGAMILTVDLLPSSFAASWAPLTVQVYVYVVRLFAGWIVEWTTTVCPSIGPIPHSSLGMEICTIGGEM